MGYTDLVGYAAATLTTIAFVPQAYKTWKSKSAKDISLTMFLMFTLGVTLWLIYGLLTDAMPIIVANTTVLVLALLILYFKFKYK